MEEPRETSQSLDQLQPTIPREAFRDPKDPQNWSFSRKSKITAVLSLAAFAGVFGPLAGQLNVAQQGKLHGEGQAQISYTTSVPLAGIAFGGFFFAPLTYYIWTVSLRHSSQYSQRIISRLFAGIFGGVPSVMAPRLLVDLYPPNERGRAFNIFHSALLLGMTAGPTFSAFLSAGTVQPAECWWTVAILGTTIVLVFLVLEKTDPKQGHDVLVVRLPDSFLRNRIATFFFGAKAVPPLTPMQILRIAALPLSIGISPVTILMGVFSFINFGIYFAVNAVTAAWLQKPKRDHGYEFTPQQIAAFTFVSWGGLLVAFLYGHFLNDRLPAAFRERNGIWQPEYRLRSLWIALLIPIGLALSGITLQYHLSWALLVIAHLSVAIGSFCIVPIAVSYICDCFLPYPAMVGIAMGAYRLTFALTIAFFIDPWVAAVSVGWAYGMMAIMSMVSMLLLLILDWKGDWIRQYRFYGLLPTPISGSQSEIDGLMRRMNERSTQ